MRMAFSPLQRDRYPYQCLRILCVHADGVRSQGGTYCDWYPYQRLGRGLFRYNAEELGYGLEAAGLLSWFLGQLPLREIHSVLIRLP